MSTKIEVILDAYSQLRISGLTKQPAPEDIEAALWRLEGMVAEMDLNIGYNYEDNPNVNSPTNVERRFRNALATNLAVRMVDFGKPVPVELQRQANQSYSAMLGATVTPREAQFPGRFPRGSGNTIRFNYGYRFNKPAPRAPNEPQTKRMVVGEINDYVEHFDSYLNASETIASYTIEANDGLNILSDSLATPDVNYRIEAVATATDNSCDLNVIIVATTSSGRVETRIVSFVVAPL